MWSSKTYNSTLALFRACDHRVLSIYGKEQNGKALIFHFTPRRQKVMRLGRHIMKAFQFVDELTFTFEARSNHLSASLCFKPSESIPRRVIYILALCVFIICY